MTRQKGTARRATSRSTAAARTARRTGGESPRAKRITRKTTRAAPERRPEEAAPVEPALEAAAPLPEPAPAPQPAGDPDPALAAAPDPAPDPAPAPALAPDRADEAEPPEEAPAPLPPPPALAEDERRRRADVLLAAARELLRRVFRFPALRPGQEPVMRSVFELRDTLAIMPTGSGKSLTYQLPALVLPGTTFVVSPLLALIEDQVGKLRGLGIPVARIDSTVSTRERNAELAAIRAGQRKLVFITPESITSGPMREALAGVRASLLVIDESHCVSQWGHDFRPSYLALRHAAIDLGRPPVLALTATATPQVAEDIQTQLGITARVFRRSFYRPNLFFEVRRHESEADKLRTVGKLIKRLRRPGIVYCATVRAVDDLYLALRRGGIPVLRYHGRMTRDERETSQARFMQPGKRLIMLATNAFGLGVDKADVRFVLHFHLPGSPEAYTQEAGRGGRDARPARCILLDAPDDVKIQEYFLQDSQPTKHEARRVVEGLYAWTDEGRPVNARDLATSVSLPERRVRTILAALEELDVAQEADARWSGVQPRPTREQLLRAASAFEKRRISDRRHLDEILAYIRTVGCRAQFLRQYFGEEDAGPCGFCDGCKAKGVVRPGAPRADFHEEEAREDERRGRGRGRRRRGRHRRGEPFVTWSAPSPAPPRPVAPAAPPLPAALPVSGPDGAGLPWASLAEGFPAFGLLPRAADVRGDAE